MITMTKIGQMGRLGNQLWQIAALIGYAKKHGVGWGVPYGYNPPMFPRRFPKVSPQVFEELSFKNYKETAFTYSPIPFEEDTHLNIEGYFQSEKYFKNAQQWVKTWFTPNVTIVNKLKEKYPICFDKEIFCIGIHVRRQDFANEVKDYYNNLTFVYYWEAINKIFQIHNIIFTPIFCFSDDIPWCREHLNDLGITHYAGGNTPEEDLILMSNLSAIVTANSSFSWWGAYLSLLNNNAKTVISPGGSKWPWWGPKREVGYTDTSDLIPEHETWIAI